MKEFGGIIIDGKFIPFTKEQRLVAFEERYLASLQVMKDNHHFHPKKKNEERKNDKI